MQILHVLAPARVGGLERVVEALSVGHARKGHSVHVAAVVGSRRDAEAFLRPLHSQGVHTYPIVIPARAYLRERAAIRALCNDLAPAVLHTHGYRPDILLAGLAKRLRIPIVTTVHGFTGGGWRNRLYEALQLRAFRRFDAVVAVSEPLAAVLRRRGVPERSLRVIVNSWSPVSQLESRSAARARLGLPSMAYCVGWVGRLTREKGADILVEAVAHLRPDTLVSFIGEGPELARLAARCAALGVSARVRWHGHVDSAGALLSAFDAFVLTSRTEGTPIVVFEAMAAGVPVVASRVGGVPDVVTEAEAVLVPTEDVLAFATAIDHMREDSSAAIRALRATERLQEFFAVDPWLAAYEALYREVAPSNRS